MRKSGIEFVGNIEKIPLPVMFFFYFEDWNITVFSTPSILIGRL
jgi:hypothetical protein